MTIENQIKSALVQAFNDLYNSVIDEKILQLQLTRKDMKGDYTLVVFPLLKLSKKNPVETGNDLGAAVLKLCSDVSSFEVINGFLNLTLSHAYWIRALQVIGGNETHGFKSADAHSPLVMIEYSSPNTNKPLSYNFV